MTGKELILYILENNLENKQVFENGKFLGFLTVEEAAKKFDVGVATIHTWKTLGWLNYIEFEGVVLIPANAEIKKSKKGV